MFSWRRKQWVEILGGNSIPLRPPNKSWRYHKNILYSLSTYVDCLLILGILSSFHRYVCFSSLFTYSFFNGLYMARWVMIALSMILSHLLLTQVVKGAYHKNPSEKQMVEILRIILLVFSFLLRLSKEFVKHFNTLGLSDSYIESWRDWKIHRG